MQLDSVPVILFLLLVTLLCSRQAYIKYHQIGEGLRDNKRIDFLVIGAHECGTDNLNHLLTQHPKLKNRVGAAHFFDTFWHKGIDYYYQKLAHVEDDQLSFETTPSYFTDPNVPQRVFETNPVRDRQFKWNIFQSV